MTAGTEKGALRRALLLIALSTTVVVAIEFIIVGLLPVMASDLGVSLAQAGHLVGAFGLSAALLGPPLTLAASRQPARRVLISGLLVFAAGNACALIFPVYGVLLAVRILQGATLPVFVSISAAAVTKLVPPDQHAGVLAKANIGFAIGIVVAMPMGVAMAEQGSWTLPFLVLALLAAGSALLVTTSFPRLGAPGAEPPARQVELLRQPSFLGHLALSVAAFGAMFAAYTYLSAWLADAAHIGNYGVAAALAGFGAAGLVGNEMAGRLGGAAPLLATSVATGLVALAATALSPLHAMSPILVLLLAFWGMSQTACVTLCQIRVALAGAAAPAFALSLNISAANLGIALGAWLGGAVVDDWGVTAIGLGALASLPLVGVLAALTALLEKRAFRRGTLTIAN